MELKFEAVRHRAMRTKGVDHHWGDTYHGHSADRGDAERMEPFQWLSAADRGDDGC